MLKIDQSLLRDLGLSEDIPAARQNDVLRWLYETLEMRVGMTLADQMTNAQLDEFEAYFEAKDDHGAFEWLQRNFPGYKDIVQREYDLLCEELRQALPEIEAQIRLELAVAESDPTVVA